MVALNSDIDVFLTIVAVPTEVVHPVVTTVSTEGRAGVIVVGRIERVRDTARVGYYDVPIPRR